MLHLIRRLFGHAHDDDAMASRARVLIGLGNPGPEYEASRHNVGFRVADRVASLCRASFDEQKGNAVQGRGTWKGRRVVVAKPTTFMNRSGRAVQALMRQHGVTSREILVFVDDIHLPLGEVRLRAGGGAGGHNGIQDVIERLGGGDFPRLRIGIGSAFGRGRQSDYVLSAFEADEEADVNEALDRAAMAALTFVTVGVEVAMSRHNRRVGRGD